jgi:hypothetical protein
LAILDFRAVVEAMSREAGTLQAEHLRTTPSLLTGTVQVMGIYSSSCLTKSTGHGKARHSQTVKKPSEVSIST